MMTILSKYNLCFSTSGLFSWCKYSLHMSVLQMLLQVSCHHTHDLSTSTSNPDSFGDGYLRCHNTECEYSDGTVPQQ